MKVFDILGGLSGKELRRLDLHVRGSCQGKTLLLWKAVRRSRNAKGEKGAADPLTLWKTALEDTPYDPIAYQYAMEELKASIFEFLYLNYMDTLLPEEAGAHDLKLLGGDQMTYCFFGRLGTSDSKVAFSGSDNVYLGFLANRELYYRQVHRNASVQPDATLELLDQLKLGYVLQYLKICIENALVRRVYQHQEIPPDPDTQRLILSLKNGRWEGLAYALVGLYEELQQLIQSEPSPAGIDRSAALWGQVLLHSASMDKGELRYLSNTVLNYLVVAYVRRGTLPQSAIELCRELMTRIYALRIDRGMLLVDKGLMKSDFKNMVTLHLEQGNADGLEAFLRRNQVLLTEMEAPWLVDFAWARLAFERGRYSDSLKITKGVHLPKNAILDRLDVQIVLIKSAIELGELEQATETINASLRLLDRDRRLGPEKKAIRVSRLQLLRDLIAALNYETGQYRDPEVLLRKVDVLRSALKMNPHMLDHAYFEKWVDVLVERNQADRHW